MKPIDFKQINSYALSSIRSVLSHWLPNGKLSNGEYSVLNPLRDDTKLGSFSINVNTGVWADFATSDKGSDVISLVAYLDNCGQREAAEKLVEFLNLNKSGTGGRNGKPPPKPKPQPLKETVTPVPSDAPPPPLPSTGLHWKYTDAQGNTVFYICRVDKPDGGKFFYPLSFSKNKGWVKKGIPAPRPLYRLHEVSKYKTTVLITEGEKACTASQKLFPDMVCTTPPNGAQSPRNADWTPLKNREVVVWADADLPGAKFADAVADLAYKAGAVSVKKINLDVFLGVDALGNMQALPKGWDAADALEAGLGIAQMDKLMQKSGFFVEAPKPSDEANNQTAKTPLIKWGNPKPLTSGLLPVMNFDYALLPKSLKIFVANEQERLGCAVDYIAVSVMTALSSSLGNSVLVKPKRKDNWQVCPNLWCALIGSPSAMKSPAKKAALKPLKKIDAEYLKTYKEILKGYAVNKKAHELHENAVIKKAARPDLSPDKRKQILKEAAIDEPEKPVLRSLIVEDVTVEALGIRLADNPRGLLVDYDELSGFISRLERPDHPTDKAFYLKAFDGLESTKVDRVSRDAIFLHRTTLSILGTIQPDKLIDIVSGALDGTSDDGLLQRFQLMVYPDAVATGFLDNSPNSEAVRKYETIVSNMEAFRKRDKRLILPLDDEAYDRFKNWWDKAYKDIAIKGYNSALESHLGKYKSLVPSLAVIIELADNHKAMAITGQSMEKALGWARYLFSHAKRIYGIGFNGDYENAKILVDRLDNLPNPFKVDTVQRKHWTGLKHTSTIKKALKVLEDNYYIRSDTVRGVSGGRPSQVYYINPNI